MTLWPEGMFGRTLLIVVVLLVSMGSMATPLADFFFNEARARRLADLELNRARLVSAAYRLIPAPERERFARELMSSQGIGIAAHPATSIPSPTRGLAGAWVTEIQRRSGNNQAVQLGGLRGRPGLWINAGIAPDALWIFLPRPLPVETLIWPWFASAAIAIALAIFGAAAIVWRINRPLRELTAAAEHLAR